MSGAGGDLFAQIADVIGLPAAVRLAEAKGGGRMSVPARVPAGHWLVDLLGREAADRLCAHFRTLSAEGGERGAELDMPRGPTGSIHQARRRLAECLDAGASADTAARAAGMTRRSAYRLKARRDRKTDDRQLPLL